jgi:L-aspartate oxidase
MRTDTLIIGSGIAGATAALRLAQDLQREITLITRTGDPIESNSRYAQGGIVSRGEDDSQKILVEDIIAAGDGLTYPPAAELVAEEGPRLLQEILIADCDLKFDRDAQGNTIYGLEAAHSRRRILHVGDRTGQAIMQAMIKKIKEKHNINLLTSHTVVDLITFPHHAQDPLAVYSPLSCHGAYVFNQLTRQVEPVLAANTILATGGLGQIFLNTTNPVGARGDGLAMAYRAGARVANLEYIQFHPTALNTPGVIKFLISEAVRGEGGILLTPDGEPFMQRYSPEWKDLAPRDVVARSIYWEMLDHGYPYVLLDIASQRSPSYIKERFPQIYDNCLKLNIDITRQPIPVVPAAHYSCGGVLVDTWGHTTISGLYAIGEVSCTGLHGANRLASTSLLEGLVWGSRAAQDIHNQSHREILQENAIPNWDDSRLVYEPDPTLIQGDMQSIRNLMWHYVGLVRSEHRLNRAVRELRHLWLDIEDFYRKTRLSDGLIGLRNAVQCALTISMFALHNRTSRGSHFREDSREPAALPSVEQLSKLSSGLSEN